MPIARDGDDDDESAEAWLESLSSDILLLLALALLSPILPPLLRLLVLLLLALELVLTRLLVLLCVLLVVHWLAMDSPPVPSAQASTDRPPVPFTSSSLSTTRCCGCADLASYVCIGIGVLDDDDCTSVDTAGTDAIPDTDAVVIAGAIASDVAATIVAPLFGELPCSRRKEFVAGSGSDGFKIVADDDDDDSGFVDNDGKEEDKDDADDDNNDSSDMPLT